MEPMTEHEEFLFVEDCYVEVNEDNISATKFYYKVGNVGFELTGIHLKVFANYGHDPVDGTPIKIEEYNYLSYIEACQKWKELNNKMKELASKEVE